jgi:hypothetical protein
MGYNKLIHNCDNNWQQNVLILYYYDHNFTVFMKENCLSNEYPQGFFSGKLIFIFYLSQVSHYTCSTNKTNNKVLVLENIRKSCHIYHLFILLWNATSVWFQVKLMNQYSILQ